MSQIQNDSQVLGKRKNVLKDDPEQDLQVTASLRDQQLEKLASKLEDMDIGNKVVQMWDTANADRSDWLERQNAYLKEIDEFIDPIYKPALDWSSTLHLPTILTVCKTYHSRMFQALWGIDPPFVCRSRTSANADRAMLIEDLMRYTLRDWANEYDGVEEEIDNWLWDWITKGDAFLKARWAKKFTRYMDIQDEPFEDVEMQADPETGDSIIVPIVRTVEREVIKTEEVYNGPMLQRAYVEDIVVIGGDGDPQKADAVLEQSWMTASDLWTYVDQKLFRKSAVEEAIKGGKDYKTGNDATEAIKQTQIEQGGRSMLDRTIDIDRYRVIEAYLQLDVDGSGINSDIIVWVHARSREILRATYLRRVMPSGKRPYFKISFHKRHGVEYSVGLVELLYSLGKEIDAMHNINVDIGILSSLPFGFYRPTASSLKETELPIEPGALIPVDNPQTDVMFPNLGMKTSFGFQEHAALMNQVERLTSISDLNFGLQTAQGAARTATGTRALLGESSNNLSVYIARMNRGWKRALRYMFEMLQYRLPPGFQFRVLGDDGNSYWQEIPDKQAICGMYDFELDANSANSNKQVQIEQANLMYQLTSDPINLQLGIVTPSNRYEAVLNLLKVNGVKDVAKYASRPPEYHLSLSPLEMADRLLHGIDIRFSPMDDLEGFIALVQEFIETEELNGQFNASQLGVLQAKAQEAAQLMQAIQAAQANAMVAQQQNMNTRASMVPGNMQQLQLVGEPQQGEGA